MDIEKVKKVRKDICLLEPDIAENIKGNREKVSEIRLGLGGADKKLDALLYDKEHYFDEGYFVSKTPEELYREIIEEIDRMMEEVLDAI